MNKQMQILSFNQPINLVEEGNWLLGVFSFEATNSVFKITDENNNFSITIEGHWYSRGGAGTNNKLQKLLQPRSKNDIKLHVEEVRKKGILTKLGDKDYNLSDLDTRKEDVIEELKSAKKNRAKRKEELKRIQRSWRPGF